MNLVTFSQLLIEVIVQIYMARPDASPFEGGLPSVTKDELRQAVRRLIQDQLSEEGLKRIPTYEKFLEDKINSTTKDVYAGIDDVHRNLALQVDKYLTVDYIQGMMKDTCIYKRLSGPIEHDQSKSQMPVMICEAAESLRDQINNFRCQAQNRIEADSNGILERLRLYQLHRIDQASEHVGRIAGCIFSNLLKLVLLFCLMGLCYISAWTAMKIISPGYAMLVIASEAVTTGLVDDLRLSHMNAIARDYYAERPWEDRVIDDSSSLNWARCGHDLNSEPIGQQVWSLQSSLEQTIGTMAMALHNRIHSYRRHLLRSASDFHERMQVGLFDDGQIARRLSATIATEDMLFDTITKTVKESVDHASVRYGMISVIMSAYCLLPLLHSTWQFSQVGTNSIIAAILLMPIIEVAGPIANNFAHSAARSTFQSCAIHIASKGNACLVAVINRLFRYLNLLIDQACCYTAERLTEFLDPTPIFLQQFACEIVDLTKQALQEVAAQSSQYCAQEKGLPSTQPDTNMNDSAQSNQMISSNSIKLLESARGLTYRMVDSVSGFTQRNVQRIQSTYFKFLDRVIQ